MVRGELGFYFIEVFEGEILSQILLSIWAEPENKQKQNWEGVGIFIFFKDSLADTGGRGGVVTDRFRVI